MLCCTSFHASAVVNAEKTRVVFNSGGIAESLSLVNSEKEPVVVQVWTDNGDPTVSPDKVHTPIVINRLRSYNRLYLLSIIMRL
ncbi:MAG: hypothetical protein EOO01_16905 [Chitinophagaceae bacterium]|nr:MAG: hypothetical protein EOO01_16905 [Chitinophagaceae bacterium]